MKRAYYRLRYGGFTEQTARLVSAWDRGQLELHARLLEVYRKSGYLDRR